MFRSWFCVVFALLAIAVPAAEWVDYPGYDIPGYGRKIVLISGDQEYRSEETLPQLARMLAQHQGFHCRVLFCQNPDNPGVVDPEHAGHVPGLEALKTADALILAVRFLNLPDEQMQMIDDYLRSGRPVLGLRTTNHGFNIPADSKWAHYHWQYGEDWTSGKAVPSEIPKNKEAWRGGFGQLVFGGKFIDHHGWKMHNSTLGVPAGQRLDHPTLRGLRDMKKTPIWGPSFVYGINTPLRDNCEVLVYGRVLDGMKVDSPTLGPRPYEHSPKSLAPNAAGKNDPMMPIAWTTEYRVPGGRPGLAFHSTIAASQDFESEGVRRLIVNGVYWLFGIIPPEDGAVVDLVGAFETSAFEFRRGDKWQQRGLKISSFEHPIVPKSTEPADESFHDPAGGRAGKVYADHPVNRFRLYDFYTRQAEAMMDLDERPTLLPDYRGIDGGRFGHWGAYHKNSFDDNRHNSAAHGSAIAAALNPKGLRVRGAKLPRGLAFRLGDGVSCAFDAESLRMIQVWQGDFVRFHPHRWGLGDGMAPEGETVLSLSFKERKAPPDSEFLGYYQHGDKNVIAYRVRGVLVHEHPWAENGVFYRHFEFPEGATHLELPTPAAPASADADITFVAGEHGRVKETSILFKDVPKGGKVLVSTAWRPKARPKTSMASPGELMKAGPDLWQWTFETAGKLARNRQGAYVQDEIPLPLINPYGAPMCLGGIAFLSDGRAAVTTYMGDVWLVSGLDDGLKKITWKRFATGLNHALGVEVIDDKIIVLGRDRLTRLHDLNDDGMADFYESFSQAFEPSAGGHSFYVGLQKDKDNNLTFTASINTVRVSADGKTATVLNEGSGQRNPNGVGVTPDGVAFSSANEGDWTPASAIFEVKEGDFYGRNAGRVKLPVAPPLVFVPRGIDNSTGSQIYIDSDKWGLPPGVMLSTSFGSGVVYGLLRDTHWSERTQGAVFPLPFDFASGTHRGRFAPHDGQLYLVGADGWGNYAIQDGHLDRVRYTGGPVTYPVGWRAHDNGLTIELQTPLDPGSVKPENFLLQQWHYQFSEAYGCRELSFKLPDQAGHDEVAVSTVKLSDDGRLLHIGIPDIMPVECLHVHARLKTDKGLPFLLDTFHTLLHLDAANPELPPRRSPEKGAAKTELELDIKFVLGGRDLPWTRNMFKEGTNTRLIKIEALPGLKFDQTLLTAKPGEALRIEFKNKDPLMPHNIVFVEQGAALEVGNASNMLFVDGSAAAAKKHYVPDSKKVLYHSSVLVHNRGQNLYVRAPEKPGDYPYLCTFPGHWGAMRGILRVAE